MALDLMNLPLRGLPPEIAENLRTFQSNYFDVGAKHGFSSEELTHRWTLFVHWVAEAYRSPLTIQPLRDSERAPFNFLEFGVEFFRALIDGDHSECLGNWSSVEGQLDRGENVVLLGNHQTEADPQAIHLLLESRYGHLSDRMMVIAGERVLKDPIAVPFSRGLRLVCVYSRRHMEDFPEEKAEKIHHNRMAMETLGQQFKEGGVLLYIAPAGGRDRPNEQGELLPTRFDPDSIEMLRLMAHKSGCTTHFYPLALYTYTMLPPPTSVEKRIGEQRWSLGGRIAMSLAPELCWDNTPPGKEGRLLRGEQAWNAVMEAYSGLVSATAPGTV